MWRAPLPDLVHRTRRNRARHEPPLRDEQRVPVTTEVTERPVAVMVSPCLCAPAGASQKTFAPCTLLNTIESTRAGHTRGVVRRSACHRSVGRLRF